MLRPTTWTEIAPHDCEYLLRSCATGRFLYTYLTLPAVQPTDFLSDGSRLLFLAPPKFRITQGYVCSFHVQANDDAWTVTAHGPVSLQHRALPRSGGVASGVELVAVEPNEPLVLDVQLLVGHRLQQQATSA